MKEINPQNQLRDTLLLKLVSGEVKVKKLKILFRSCRDGNIPTNKSIFEFSKKHK